MDFSGSSPSSPSSPNTKPEHRYHQCCCDAKPGSSGPSCASVPLPKPDSRQRCAKYVVKSSEILWNSHSHKKSQRLLPHASHTSSDAHISCGLQWNETNKLKFTQICMMDLAHLSTNPLCSFPFTHVTISHSTSSVWIHIALPPPLMTASSPNTKPTMRWNHLRYFEITSRNLNAFYRMLLILPLMLTYHVVSNEMKRTSSNSLRSAWWTWHISAPIPYVVFLSLISPFHCRLALSGSILSFLSLHDRFLRILTILTKHQAWAPASPMLLWFKARFVRVELCFSPSANASQETKIPSSFSKLQGLWNSLQCGSCHTGIRHIEHQLDNASGFGRFCSSHFALARRQPARMPSKWSHHSGHPEFSKFWDCSTEPCAPPGPCRVETEDPSRIQMRDCAENKRCNRYKKEGIEEKHEKAISSPNHDWKSIQPLLAYLSWTFISGKPCSKLLSLSEWGRLIFAALELQNL